MAATAAVVLGLANTVAVVLLVRAASQTMEAETTQGLPLGAALPRFHTVALDGTRVTEKAVSGQILLFLGAKCRSCHRVARELATAPNALFRLLVVFVIGDAAPFGDNIFELLSYVPAARMTRDPTGELATQLGTPGTPFFYVIDDSGRVRAKSETVTAAGLEAMATKVLGQG